MTSFPFPFPLRTNSFPVLTEQADIVAILELDEAQLELASGGRCCGAGSGGKVGEVPVVTG